MEPTGLALIGCGYWGLKYLRVLGDFPDADVRLVCDQRGERLTKLRTRNPDVRFTTDHEEAIRDPSVEAVIIATEANSHYTLSRTALEAGKHVLVEKPLTTNLGEARALVDLARERDRILLVGHTFLYNEAVRKIKEYLRGAELGRLYYLYARRTNLGPVRDDVNAIWDLASHDVAIFNYLLDMTPTWVSATGSRILRDSREDVGFISLSYPSEIMAHIHVSWAEPNKVREVVVVGSDRRIVFNDIDPLERVRIFDKGVKVVPSEESSSFGEYQLLLRDGDITSPAINPSEPLKNQAGHFLHCIRREEEPFTGGKVGAEVVGVIEAIDKSIGKFGAPVFVENRTVVNDQHDHVFSHTAR